MEADMIATLQENGFTREQCAQLLALRERVRRARHGAEGAGTVAEDTMAERRLEFARWLVEHGRLGESLTPGQ
jgi:hypothetical protein